MLTSQLDALGSVLHYVTDELIQKRPCGGTGKCVANLAYFPVFTAHHTIPPHIQYGKTVTYAACQSIQVFEARG